jgi:integrase
LCEPTPACDKPFHLDNFIHQLKIDGYSEETIEPIYKGLKRLAKRCDINNPYEIKETLANLKWKNSTKKTVASYYTKYLQFIGKTWNRPRYKVEQKFPFIPTEQEIDQLIASAHTHKHAVNMQILKETGIRTDELTKLKWTDINTEQKTITVTPSKGNNPRILPISNKLIGMLNQLPKTNTKICTMQKHTIRTVFTALRNQTAKKLNNPRIKQITLHTFRHWKATMEYHKTHDSARAKLKGCFYVESGGILPVSTP